MLKFKQKPVTQVCAFTFLVCVVYHKYMYKALGVCPVCLAVTGLALGCVAHCNIVVYTTD